MRRQTINDATNFIAKLSLAKCLNASKVFISYGLSRLIGKPFILGMPLAISVEPTTTCNLSCPECPSGLKSFTRPTGRIDVSVFKQYIDALKGQLIYLSFYFQGEPYLHKGFLDMVGYATRLGIYTATSTNAHFLNDENAKKTVESGLDRLIISLDGATQEAYQKYRMGGELDKVIAGTKRLLSWRAALKSKTPFVVFQFLVLRHNEMEIESIRKMAKEMGGG